MNNTNLNTELTVKETGNLVGIGEKKLFELLRKQKVLNNNNAAKHEFVKQGLLKNKIKKFQHPTIGTQLYTQAYFTEKGIEWLNKQLEKTSCH